MTAPPRGLRAASGKGPPPYAVSGLAVLAVPPKTSSRRESSDGLGGTASAASPDTAEGGGPFPEASLRARAAVAMCLNNSGL